MAKEPSKAYFVLDREKDSKTEKKGDILDLLRDDYP